MNPSESHNVGFAATKVIGALIVAGILLGALWWWRACHHDNTVAFLPATGPAEWIVYPKPPDTRPHQVLPFAGVFRRVWTITSLPPNATLSVRAFRQGQVQINGQSVEGIHLSGQDWKTIQTGDVTRFLRAGENEISVTVTNSLGPPALWLSLNAGNTGLLSDTNWEVSFAGAVWQKAAFASAPPVIRPGNFLFGRERVADSISRTWPVLVVLLLVSVGVTAAVILFRRKQETSVLGSAKATGFRKWLQADNAPKTVLALILVAWAILFANNLPLIAPVLGFDRDGHLEYVDYILKNGALPLASDGWQMYQPPLFYVLSALIVLPFGGVASSDPGVMVLRIFSMTTGMAMVVVVFLCLRLLFPKQPGRQITGLLLAGFLPANVCLAHHVTNENLSALLFTVTLYFTLRVTRGGKPSVGLLVATGGFLGLSLLTKFSTVLAVPLILIAVAWKPLFDKKPAPAFRAGGIVFVTFLVVCGWHFARVWRRFGTPLMGNWDPRLSFAWWQDPGYHTGNWYVRFGDALVSPLFSSINGIADGVYATLWGDGLCSGSAVMSFRPQWNYDLMNWGYVLALPATLTLLTGIAAALARLLRRPNPEYFLMLGLLFAFAAGIALMSLRVPSYAQVKAFYGLPALLPLCALFVVGWDFLATRLRRLEPLLAIGLLLWVMTMLGAFWIRSSQPFTYTVRGIGLAEDGRFQEAAAEFSKALALDPTSLRGGIGLASALNDVGQSEEGHAQAAKVLAQHPGNGQALIELGILLGINHHYEQAIEPLAKGLGLEPDDPRGYAQLAGSLAHLGRNKEAVQACAEGLRVDPFNEDLHQDMGVALIELGDLTNAVGQLRLAVQLKPSWAQARSGLALALASLGRLNESAEQYGKAVEASPNDTALRFQFAVALTMQGNAQAATEQYYELLAREPDNIQAINNLAWILAVNATDAARNGTEAVRLAERACELTQHQQPVLLGTLAAAYAEAGRFKDAVATAEKARDLATAGGQQDVAAKNLQLLELYRAGKPFREPAAVASH